MRGISLYVIVLEDTEELPVRNMREKIIKTAIPET